ncbi:MULTISPECIES: carbohydrate ABC transporter permease [Haloarcula]|uniref:Sugar ABC transporter permease n=1 Tax=Haloarcula pellucida TaxID=1427151 RepID=A0A830GMU1_9EURY|nr:MULTISPECIES: carbohydrate ABC transporter permease [Halomicroarcula]MBX0349652.1 carbohydrate ABC transporter permease [Halomicroarcula pellucida]MDS0279795.1 carbohydrate ABC transporter permease [Halomicroarcula sp. S1AR25-4]GGN95722.1 sugar ABC transporter permease [Halomicroarcula pellucida]
MPRSNYDYPGYERSGTTYWTKTTLLYAGVIGGALLWSLPFWWMLATSVTANPSAASITLLPSNPTLDHYEALFSTQPIGKWFFNTIVFAGSVTAFNLIFDSLAGYALAKVDFIGREKFFLLFMSTMMIPAMVTLIPVYVFLAKLGWVNTYQGLVAPMIANPIGIFLLRQHFKGMPSALGDAAKIDGCNELQTFYKVYLPLAKPALATLGIYTFIMTWNNFQWPLIIASDDSMYTLPVALFSVRNQFFTEWGLVMAAAAIIVMPVILVFLSAQRYFIRGMTLSGVKG